MVSEIFVPPRVSPHWLALREPADDAARAVDSVGPISASVAAHADPQRRGATSLIYDLGSGTGSMARWLAPRLPGAQHWILLDRDPDLLARGAADPPVASADGGPVTVHTRVRDITRLSADDLSSATLVTASALLDMLTDDELHRVVASCVRAGCPALLTLSVTGEVTLTPRDEWDAPVSAAFNAHQRRVASGRPLLGPDAVAVAAAAFGRAGWTVTTAPSPWRLGPGSADLIARWFDGWLDAAVEQAPDLRAPAEAYARRRRHALAADQLTAEVGHVDLLAWPP